MSSAWHGPVACTLARWLNSDQPRENPPLRPPQIPTLLAHPHPSHIPVFHCRPRQLGCPRPNPTKERLEGRAGVQAGQAERQKKEGGVQGRKEAELREDPTWGQESQVDHREGKQERRWGSSGCPDTWWGQLLCEQ